MKWLAALLLTLSPLAHASTPPTSAELAYFEGKNFLVNPAFELGQGSVVASGGSLGISSSYGRTGAGAQWDSSASGQTLTLQAKQAYTGLENEPGYGYCRVKCPSGTCTHTLQAYDGTNILSSQTIPSSTNWALAEVSFPYPASGRVDLRLVSVASNEPAVRTDDCSIGVDSRIVKISQTTKVGTITWAGATNCSWTTTATIGNYSADTDCATPTITETVSGSLSAPGTKIPAVIINNAQGGRYFFVATGLFYKGSNTDAGASWRFHDGTNGSTQTRLYRVSGDMSYGHVIGDLEIPAGATRTVNLQGGIGNAAATAQVSNNDTSASFTIDVYRYPSSADTGLRVENMNWRVSAGISGGNASLSTSSVASYTGIENGSLTLTNDTGTGVIAAQIPCSSTNPPTGTTCAAGNESVGVYFNLPQAGDVLICPSFTHHARKTTSGSVDAAFVVAETASNSQTIIQQTIAPMGSMPAYITTTGENVADGNPVSFCRPMTFGSAGYKTLRLMYRQTVSGTVLNTELLSDGSFGGRGIHWLIIPLNYASGAFPYFTPPTDFIYYDDHAGYGSTNTKIPYMTNQQALTGTALSQNTNDATSGLSVRVNKAGVYSCTYGTDAASGAVAAISVNSSALTTNASSLTYAQGRRCYSDAGSTSASMTPSCSFTGPFSVGDLIRPHTDGVAATVAATRQFFTCARVSNP